MTKSELTENLEQIRNEVKTAPPEYLELLLSYAHYYLKKFKKENGRRTQ